MTKRKKVLPTVHGLQTQRKQTLAAVDAVRAYCEQVFSSELKPAIVGGEWTGGVLTVNCTAATLVQELEAFHRAPLLEAVRQRAPNVARIRICLV